MHEYMMLYYIYIIALNGIIKLNLTTNLRKKSPKKWLKILDAFSMLRIKSKRI